MRTEHPCALSSCPPVEHGQKISSRQLIMNENDMCQVWPEALKSPRISLYALLSSVLEL